METVQRLVQRLDPTLIASDFGCSPLILKIYPGEPEWKPSKEILVAGWLKGLTPPIPKWLRVDESRTVLPLRFALLTLLPGRSLRHWMAEPDIHHAYRQMGELLRRIHAVPMSAYGYVRGHRIDKPRSANADYMTAAFEDVFRRFRNLGGDAALGCRLQHLAEGNFDLLAESDGPVLCHDDFHQGNVLASRDDAGGLQLSGLIDFGNARAADKLFDLAKALFCSSHEDPRSYQLIREGYGQVDHPDTERALWLYTLFHRLSMWRWLTKLGAGATAADGPGGLVRDLREMAGLRNELTDGLLRSGRSQRG